MTKLKHLLNEMFDEQPKVNRNEVLESVRGYGQIGQSLYSNGNIMEVAQKLTQIAESAHTHILGEQDDWFDKVSVNKNMNFLKGSVKEFKKTANEAHQLNQRLQGLYEDIGHVLNRYYDIDEHVMTEKMDPVGQEDGDIDNDGDMDSSDEYLLNRRDTIDKAITGEDLEQNLDERLPHYADGKEISRALSPSKPTKYFKPTSYERDEETGDIYGGGRETNFRTGGLKNKRKIGATTGFNENIEEFSVIGRNLDKLSPPDVKHNTMTGIMKPNLNKHQLKGIYQGYKVADDFADADLSFDDAMEAGKELYGMAKKGQVKPEDLLHTRYDQGGWVSQQEGVEESPDARLLRLAGITKEAVEANKPTKRLSDIKGAGLVTPGAVGGLNKKS